jgi:hypothetical protein
MTKFVHIVRGHPVELGEPNLYKVEFEKEFDTEEDAEYWIETFNWVNKSLRTTHGPDYVPARKAVYYGLCQR